MLNSPVPLPSKCNAMLQGDFEAWTSTKQTTCSLYQWAHVLFSCCLPPLVSYKKFEENVTIPWIERVHLSDHCILWSSCWKCSTSNDKLREKKVALVPYHHGIRLTEGLEAHCQDFRALGMYERQRLLHYPVALQLEKYPRYTLCKRRLVLHQICKAWWLM